jgi:hypothetical protein
MSKWYAFYENPTMYELMNEKSWNEIMNDPCESREAERMIANFNEFNNLKEAKSYLIYHMKSDIMELKNCIDQVKSYKVKTK